MRAIARLLSARLRDRRAPAVLRIPGGRRAASSTKNVSPRPGRVRDAIVPPIASARPRESVSPSPVPSTSVGRREPLERQEHARSCLGSESGPGVGDGDAQLPGVGLAKTRPTRPPGRLYLIAFDEQVEQDLLEALRVGEHVAMPAPRAMSLEGRSRARARAGRTSVDRFVSGSQQWTGSSDNGLPPASMLRDVEDLVDELQQVAAGAEDAVDAVARRRSGARARAAARNRRSS